ncbi:MAG: YfcE family phosphodiesterase [Clostridia bacterium]|nr:YfcE family phosphodiesterase [Clostridia bacterium]
MRILVLSDTHRHVALAQKAIEAQPTARHIFFLGDVLRDLEELKPLYPDRIFYAVSGNCDFASFEPSTDMERLADINIFFTHGHPYGVKYGIRHLLQAAADRNCKLALYGHTHVASIYYEDGVTCVNPGSCGASRSGANSYAVVDIEPNGIMPIIIPL